MNKIREFKKIVVDKEWIENNVKKQNWQRNLYVSRVNQFVNHLNNGTFYPSLITVAMDKDSMIILDGQHKLEAIKKAGIKQEMDFCIYHGLNEEEMVNVYTMLNNVKPMRIIDDIKIFTGKTKFLDCYMNGKKFPINVTLNGGVNSMRIDNLLTVIYNGSRKDFSRHGLSRKMIRKFIQELDEITYYKMCDFINFYKLCFGEPSKENWLYKNAVMFTIFRIWDANRKNFDIPTMVKSFKQIESNDNIRRNLSASYDIAGLELLTRQIYSVINFRRTSTKFLIFWEEDILI